MNRIPLQLFKDYGIVGLSYIAILIFLRPVFFGEYKITDSLIVVTVVHTFSLLFVYFISETFVTYIFRKPFAYSDPFYTRLQHFVLCGAVCIPLMMVIITQANTIMMHGVEHADYAWHDTNGNFTLDYLMMCRSSCVAAAFIMVIAMTAISEVRQMRFVLHELLDINHLLEENQGNIQSASISENDTEEVILQSDGRETMTVNPHDVLYVESVANYVNIIYYKDSELCQKRFRSSLKDIESALAEYPFLVHIHRAFLVNINFITQVTGNSSGYKIELFGSDKTLPVSKSNVAAFKEKINILAKFETGK